MTCAELKEQVGALALGVLTAEERAACERHLAEREHEGCLAALAEANDAVAALGLALPPLTPAPATWSAIESRTRPTVLAPTPRRRRWATVTPWLLAAAMLLALLFTLRQRQLVAHELQAALERSNDALRQRAQCASELGALQHDVEQRRDALALLQLSGTKLVALAQQGSVANVAANIIWHAGVKRGYVFGRGLSAPTDKDYELWVIRGARKIPAGILHGDASGALLTAIDPALLQEGAPDAIAVTLEAKGGGPQPLGPIVLVGKI